MRCPEFSCAEMSTLLHVKFLRQRREACCLPAKLPGIRKDDFCAAVILFQLAANLDIFTLQLPHISNFFQII